MNEEASAGEEVVQNRPTIFRKGGIFKLINMNKLLNPPAPMEEPLPHDSE